MKIKRKVNIMIADDHEVVRLGLKAGLLAFNNKFRVTGEAGNGRELIAMVKARQPDVVFLDLRMPVMNGNETLKILRSDFPSVRPIIFSYHSANYLVAQSMLDGARAFLEKNCGYEQIILTVEKVMQENFFFDDKVSKEIISMLDKDKHYRNYVIGNHVFSEREIQILALICADMTVAQIADTLHISPSTVNFHKHNLLTKSKSKTVVSLIKYAVRQCIVEP